MKCPNCGAENTGKFCSECGFLLVEQECRNCHTRFLGRTCPNCGETVPLFPEGTPAVPGSLLDGSQKAAPVQPASPLGQPEAAARDSLPPVSDRTPLEPFPPAAKGSLPSGPDTSPEPLPLITEETALPPAPDKGNPSPDSLNHPTPKTKPAVQADSEDLDGLEDSADSEDLDGLEDSAPLEQGEGKKPRFPTWPIPLGIFFLLFLLAFFFSGQFTSSLLIVSVASALVYLTMTIVQSCQKERFMLPDLICCLLSFLVFFLTLYL